MNSRIQPRPNFFIVGTFKGGTTSLHQYLSQHPDVFMPSLKETRYFAYLDVASAPTTKSIDTSQYPIRSEKEYLDLFQEARDESAIGEASPIYLDNPNVARRIADFQPDAKIIVSLRDPIARAVSGYQMWIRSGKESRPVAEALQPGVRWVEGSLYADKLQNYYRHFSSDRIKTVLFEELVKDAQSVVRRLFKFLDIDPRVEVDTRKTFNAGGMPRNRVIQKAFYRLKKIARNYPQLVAAAPDWLQSAYDSSRKKNFKPISIPVEVERQLASYFLEDAKRVKAMTGVDTDVWRLADRSLETDLRNAP